MGRRIPHYVHTKQIPPRIPAAMETYVVALMSMAAETKPSSGPKMPESLEAPGLGAPPGPLPPPSTLSVAVGSSDLDEDDVVEFDVLFEEVVLLPELVEFELELELVGEESAAEPVNVTRLVIICVSVWRSPLRPTEVESIVETCTESLLPPASSCEVNENEKGEMTNLK